MIGFRHFSADGRTVSAYDRKKYLSLFLDSLCDRLCCIVAKEADGLGVHPSMLRANKLFQRWPGCRAS